MKLFSFRCSAFVDEKLVDMPGFSHRSQPFEYKVLWYPWTESHVRAFVFARHRRHATKQLERAGVYAWDLDGGRKAECPACIAKII